MQNTGERQVGATLSAIKPDHLARYMWVVGQLSAACETPFVADIACGNGYGSFVLSERAMVLGVDISDEAILFACKHYQRTKDNPTFVQGDVRTLNINHPVECVVCFETLEHLSEITVAPMLEAFESMTDRLFLSVPNQAIIPFDAELFPFHQRHYTPDQLEGLLDENGWTIEQWWTQYNKDPGTMYPASDGRTLIVEAVK